VAGKGCSITFISVCLAGTSLSLAGTMNLWRPINFAVWSWVEGRVA